MIGRSLRENPINLQTGISDVPNSMIFVQKWYTVLALVPADVQVRCNAPDD